MHHEGVYSSVLADEDVENGGVTTAGYNNDTQQLPQQHGEVCVTTSKPGNHIIKYMSHRSVRRIVMFELDTHAPCELLERIDQDVWRRFAQHMGVAECNRYLCACYVMAASWIASIVFLDFSDTAVVVFTLSLVATIFLLRAKAHEIANQQHEKVVAKMQPTMRSQGFSMEFVGTNSCLFLFGLSVSYVRFTLLDQGPVDDGLPHHNDTPNDVFELDDWIPLIGKWEPVSSSENRNTRRSWTFCSSKQDGSDAAQFSGTVELSLRIWPFSLWKGTPRRFEITGNSLEMARGNSYESERVLKAVSITPVKRQVGATTQDFYYHQGSQGVWHLDSATSRLFMYSFQYFEDIPNDAALWAGALKSCPTDGSCGTCYAEYEKITTLDDGRLENDDASTAVEIVEWL